MSNIFFPLLFGTALVIGFWLNSLRDREKANASAKLTCNRQGFQLLDGTVSLLNWRIVKNRLALRRSYQFEYSDDGENRRKGVVIITAGIVESVVLEPW